jgi:predicted DNA-binding transcriptional regulator AlpA
MNQKSLPWIFGPHCIVDYKQMAALRNSSVSTVRRQVEAGEIPRPRRISKRRVGWTAEEAIASLPAREAAV